MKVKRYCASQLNEINMKTYKPVMTTMKRISAVAIEYNSKISLQMNEITKNVCMLLNTFKIYIERAVTLLRNMNKGKCFSNNRVTTQILLYEKLQYKSKKGSRKFFL